MPPDEVVAEIMRFRGRPAEDTVRVWLAGVLSTPDEKNNAVALTERGGAPGVRLILRMREPL